MHIIKASSSHKSTVLELLDEFRAICTSKDNPSHQLFVNTATKFGGDLFDRVIHSDSSKVFLALDGANYVGVITAHLIPQIRKGEYCIEVEEFYVKEVAQGKGVAELLMNTIVSWGENIGAHTLRLETGNNLIRAHAFYKKFGFIEYGKAFQKKI